MSYTGTVCPKCKKGVNVADKHCSNCGEALPEVSATKKKSGTGKKLGKGCLGIIGFFIVLGVIGSFLPDTSNNSNINNTKNGVSEDEENKKVEENQVEESTKNYQINEDVRVADVRWKVLKVEEKGNVLKGSKSKYPTWADDKKTSGKYIMVRFEVENLGDDLKSLTSLKITDSKGREFTSASDVSKWIPEGEELYLLDNLNPNVPEIFTDIYEVANDATGLKVKVGDLSFWGSDETWIDLGI